MQCPHCRVAFHDDWVEGRVFGDRNETALEDSDGYWQTKAQVCPACNKAIILLETAQPLLPATRDLVRYEMVRSWMAYPKGTSRPPVPQKVPQPMADDYTEACLVLGDSPKASAALSRRCLQTLLREHVKVRRGDLANEIQQVLDSGKLPSHIAQALDAVRNIGNFASHPMKSTQSGEIMDVEPGEAEWTLDVLESLFDHYFVQPEILRKKREALNDKLKEANKPPMKQ